MDANTSIPFIITLGYLGWIKFEIYLFSDVHFQSYMVICEDISHQKFNLNYCFKQPVYRLKIKPYKMVMFLSNKTIHNLKRKDTVLIYNNYW